MKKYIEIGNITFELKNNLNVKQGHELKRLENCYNKASARKYYVYKFWQEFALNNNSGAYYGIASYNSMMFTFDAQIDFEGKSYYIHITPTYNYIMEN